MKRSVAMTFIAVLTGGFQAQAQSSSVASAHAHPAYTRMVAEAIRHNMPVASGLGPGEATCRFKVASIGRVSKNSCTGSSREHMDLLRRGIASIHPPKPPGGAFYGELRMHFH